MKVIFTLRAERDLLAVGDYIAQDNPHRAKTFLLELRAQCLGLADFPERFPLMERYAAYQVRRRVHGRYLILYRIEQDAVRILNIVHGASDPETWIGG